MKKANEYILVEVQNMFAGSKAKNVSNENIVFNYVKGLIVSMLLSFAFVLLFALVLKWFSLSDACIVPIVMVIKAVCVVIGSMIAVKGESKGLIKGAVFGLIYIALSFLLFSILAGSFSYGISNLLDIVCCVILGGIVGIVKVNKK